MKKEEMVDIYNPDTLEKTGEVIAKRIAHEKGIWHSSIHLVIVNEDKLKTLFQRRASDKDLYPDAWDIAVGGHISAGEADTIAVKRELEEELGLNPEKYNIEFIKKYKEELYNNGINNKEIVSIYLMYANIDLSNLILQTEEVQDAKWITKEEMEMLIQEDKVIPHKEEYKLLRKILK